MLWCHLDKHLVSFLEGFTYYPNTVGGSTRTVVAMPHLLTGYSYTTGETYTDYVENSYKKNETYDELIKQGYDLGIYTTNTYGPQNFAKKLLNYSSSGKEVQSVKILTKKWFKFIGFKYFPHILKKYEWMYSGEFDEAALSKDENEDVSYSINNDDVFFGGLEENGFTLENENSAFRLYHLMGMHAPYTLTKEGGRNSSGTSLEEQQIGLWKILEGYFENMKKEGIYENSNIVIMADHGDINQEENPIFLIKRKGEMGVLGEDERPVSYDNFQATLLEMIGVDSEEKSVFELDMNDNEERYFYRQSGNKLIEYVVTGSAYDEKNTKKSGQVYDIFKESGEAKPYKLGKEVYFDIRSTGNNYLKSGFRSVENNFTWALGNKSEMEIPLAKKVKTDLRVKIKFFTKITDVQRVKVVVNENEIGEFTVDTNELEFDIPKEYVTDKKINIEYYFPDAIAPSEINPNTTDDSLLSFAFTSLCIDKVEE